MALFRALVIFTTGLLLLGSLQGAVADDEQPAPTESECRPYIEKALKQLGTSESPPDTIADGSTEQAQSQEQGDESGEATSDAGTIPDEAPTSGEESAEETSAEAGGRSAEASEEGATSAEEEGASTEETAPSEEAAESAEQIASAEDATSVEESAPEGGEGSAEESTEATGEEASTEEADKPPGDDVSAEEAEQVSEEVGTEEIGAPDTSEESAEAAATSAEESAEAITSQAEDESAAPSTEESAEEAPPSAEAAAPSAEDESAESATPSAEEESVEAAAPSAEDESAEEESVEAAAPSAEEESVEAAAPSSEDESAEPATPSAEEESVEAAATSAEEESVEAAATSAEEESVEAAAPSTEEESVEAATPSAEEESVEAASPSAEEESAEATTTSKEAESVEAAVPSAEEEESAEAAAPSTEEESAEAAAQSAEEESAESAPQSTEEESAEAAAQSAEEESAEATAPSAEEKSAEDAASSAEEKSVEAIASSAEEESGEAAAPGAEEESPETTAEGKSAEEADETSTEEAASAESTPEEEELTMEMDIPENLRPREHIAQILRLDAESMEKEMILSKTVEVTLKELKKVYDNAIKPLEILFKYRELSNRHFGDPEIFSKPLILFMGPWSGGKSTIINYLLDNEYKTSALRTGAEPSPAYFNILMWGDRPEIVDGTQLAADWTFSGLQKFGQGMLDRLRGLRLPNILLEKVNIVEIPGILEIRKQVERLFPFNDACQWFIDRADIIFLVYDPSKLDVGPETEAILDQLKGREYQTRIILNKADQVRPEELMRVQGTLIWNISPLMSSPEPPVMYSTSLWSMPYEVGAPTRLLNAQERAFLRDLRDAIDKRVENKIASARRFAVRVRNHAKMVDCYLTTYYNHKSFFGNKKKVSDDIIEHPQDYHIYEGLSTLTNISRYDLPDPDVYKDFFRLNPLYDFQLLSSTCTYFRGCPINRLDVAIAYDLPELVGKYKKSVETALASIQPKS